MHIFVIAMDGILLIKIKSMFLLPIRNLNFRINVLFVIGYSFNIWEHTVKVSIFGNTLLKFPQ